MTNRNALSDPDTEGRASAFMDIDRMVNEGLGGGIVTIRNGLIEDTTTDTMFYRESIFDDDGSF